MLVDAIRVPLVEALKEPFKEFSVEKKDDYVLHLNVPDSFTVEEGLELCRSVVPE